MSDLCNARKPGSVLRCDRAKKHRGFHKSMNFDKTFVEWPSHKSERRARMDGVSADQDYRTGVLHGIMAKTINEAMAASGRFYCEGGCGTSWSDCHEAMRDCTPAHVRPRAKRPTKKADIFYSEDAPVNILVTCVSCNDRVDVRHAKG